MISHYLGIPFITALKFDRPRICILSNEKLKSFLFSEVVMPSPHNFSVILTRLTDFILKTKCVISWSRELGCFLVWLPYICIYGPAIPRNLYITVWLNDICWGLGWDVNSKQHHYDNHLQGCFRFCDWLSLQCLVPWINHLSPVYWATLGKVCSKHLVCRFHLVETS